MFLPCQRYLIYIGLIQKPFLNIYPKVYTDYLLAKYHWIIPVMYFVSTWNYQAMFRVKMVFVWIKLVCDIFLVSIKCNFNIWMSRPTWNHWLVIFMNIKNWCYLGLNFKINQMVFIINIEIDPTFIADFSIKSFLQLEDRYA